MITGKAQSRPHAPEDGSAHAHGHNQIHPTPQPVVKGYPRNHEQAAQTADISVPAAPDLAENIARAARLIRLHDDQERAVRDAYQKGYADAGNDLLYVVREAWEAGYDAAETARREQWERDAEYIRDLTNSKPWRERRAAELEACKPRPGDFPGLENDPNALDRYSASVEGIGRPLRRAA